MLMHGRRMMDLGADVGKGLCNWRGSNSHRQLPVHGCFGSAGRSAVAGGQPPSRALMNRGIVAYLFQNSWV